MDEKAQQLLEKWHRVVFDEKPELLNDILAENITFYSPVVFKPKTTKDETFFVLSNVIRVFQDFKYHREFVDGNNLALEFSATVGDKSCKGIDLIEFNDDGKIVNFEVFIRPASALMALGTEMNKRFEDAGKQTGKLSWQ
ncbi:MAG TPA: nuclear transport factor 2 family protein [Spirochaetota bacterium]|nr:nuclear transport factor 2 family protein [Spirochaetota bacterium]HPJ37063.1 nuclear transport factor 2 family protein [Spirochaetota bacterium]HPQ52549.1 nuclear transport factor 2 family protein [Spirochaetota bacterium]